MYLEREINNTVERIEENNFFYIIITEALKKIRAVWYSRDKKGGILWT